MLRENLKIETPPRSNRGLEQFRCLELNADFVPMRYYPLSTLSWDQVMFLVVKGEVTGEERIQVLEYYSDVTIRSAGGKTFQLPSVIAHKKFIPRPSHVPFTKFNIFLRDDFTCQYSGKRMRPSELTFDHVIPRAMGGKTTWDNIVACSREINEFKDCRTPRGAGLKLIKPPNEPSAYELNEKGRKYPPRYLHKTWMDYLYWNAPLKE